MSYGDTPETMAMKHRLAVKWAIGIAAGALVLFFVVIGAVVLIRGINRGQARADAKNEVAISQIEIRNQAQRVQIAKQKAEIRLQDAVGVREAQDEIAKTLTPLYVQYEMIDALKAIAASGKNNSVVYIPSGANGVPLVSTVPQGQVGQPDANK